MNQRQPVDREPPPVGPPVVHSVLLVGAYDQSQNVQFEDSSLPGHLIQLMRTGVAAHRVGGRQYIISPGDLLWYHEDEQLFGQVLEAPWSWYSVNFIAPTLPPPPFERRVRRAHPAAYEHFSSLLEAWLDIDTDPALREIRVHARLLTLLADIEDEGQDGLPFRMDASARLWWEIEGELRRDLSQPVTLCRMVDMSGRSAMTISRACHEAVGLPPLKRIKQVKMSLARGLVRNSELRMGEIAARIGYSRVHEFSRDYHRHFDTTPTNDRATAE